MNYIDQTPSEIDENMVQLWMKLASEETTAARYSRILNSDYYRTEADTAKYTQKVIEAEEAVRLIEAELDEIDAEFTARGGWNRYWMVCNANGHIHRTRRCSTCRPTTEFTLVYQVSGMTDTEVIDLAGVRVCTVCYPDAPVDVLSRPSRLPYDVEARRVAEEKARAKEAARLAKDAKNLLEPVKLSGRFGETIKTLRAARIEAVDLLVRVAERAEVPNTNATRERIVDYRLLAEAIAAKEGTTVQAVGAELAPKVTKKVRANQKAVEKMRKTHPWMFQEA